MLLYRFHVRDRGAGSGTVSGEVPRQNVPGVSRGPATVGLRWASSGQGRGQGRERTYGCCKVLGFCSESTGSHGLTYRFGESLWPLRH